MKKIIVIHGPNLNMLGKREPDIYGAATLDQIDAELREIGRKKKIYVETFQSNHEGAIVDKIQETSELCIGLIINPGALTHTSISIRDALLLVNAPIIEVHLSNIYKRETFRHKSVISDIATGQIAGFGAAGYFFALKILIANSTSKNSEQANQFPKPPFRTIADITCEQKQIFKISSDQSGDVAFQRLRIIFIKSARHKTEQSNPL